MKRYLATCPHTVIVKREIGDFVTRGKHSYFKVIKVRTEVVPCREKNYVVVDAAPFRKPDGIDTTGIEVKCKGCGQNYYLFLMKKGE